MWVPVPGQKPQIGSGRNSGQSDYQLLAKVSIRLPSQNAIVAAAIATNPGICPSTPLLQPTIFCIPTSHIKANMSANTQIQCVPRHHLVQDKSSTPPNGFVIYAIPTPVPIITKAASTFAANRQYGEIFSSNLSSKNPTIPSTTAPANIPHTLLSFNGKKIHSLRPKPRVSVFRLPWGLGFRAPLLGVYV